jgi:hypothetical protein
MFKKSKWIEYESEIENSDDDDSEETVDENEGYKNCCMMPSMQLNQCLMKSMINV